MTVRSWIRRLFARTPHPIRKAPARFRPRLEALEDRVTPTAMVDVTGTLLTFTGATASSSYSLTGTATKYTFNSSEGIEVDAGAAAAGWTVSGNSATGPSKSIASIDFGSTADTENYTIGSATTANLSFVKAPIDVLPSGTGNTLTVYDWGGTD